MAPAAASCFPQYFAYTDNATTIYNCLKTAGVLCSFASECATSTYSVDQVPTVPATATPTPTNIVANAGFEAGDLSGWTLDPPNYGFVSTVVTTKSHSGSRALQNYYSNDNGFNSQLWQTVFLEPGAQYTASFWWLHENPNAWCGATILLNIPSVRNQSPGVWREVKLTFTAPASYSKLIINYYCNVGQVRYVEAYRNDIYFDDITVVKVQ
ncbi:hypothetical protein B0T16DRAFT_463531 [Cercophora newfieldiana]|uniref:CBM-cenC domain-containing protein n=1 Tax=Cercophora newfieldiana TaxID=92897 RepID=A0AA39XTE7_9PEZI|nr:hypothetical protein B0T16DRAFT_463531 [Cercophora newfieldiana]